MPNLTQKIVIHVDAELREYLEQRRVASGVPISEQIRRAINMQRYQEQWVETRAKNEARQSQTFPLGNRPIAEEARPAAAAAKNQAELALQAADHAETLACRERLTNRTLGPKK
jgi:hypothetical protein